MKLRWVHILTTALALSHVSCVPATRADAVTHTSRDNPLLKLGGLVRMCERNDATSTAACGAYITGFVAGCEAAQDAAVVRRVAEGVMDGTVAPTDSAMGAAATKLRDQSRLFCIRSHWTAGKVAANVVQYGREHPEALGEMTADHMLKVLERAFPCGGRE